MARTEIGRIPGFVMARPEGSGPSIKAYMNALFDYAYQKARRGYPWQKFPPLLAGLEQSVQAR